MDLPGISIVCPFYNEKESLAECCRRLETVAAGLGGSVEILFVDDGSTDGGGEILSGALRDPSRCRRIRLDRRRGQTSALAAGFRAARGDILVTLDADLQNPPEEIPRLLAALEDADFVNGIRVSRRDTWLKRAVARAAGAVRRAVLGDSIADGGCSLRAFRRKTLRSFFPFDGMHRFQAASAELDGFRVAQIPVAHAARLHGRSKYRSFGRVTALRDLLGMQWLMKRKIDVSLRGPDAG